MARKGWFTIPGVQGGDRSFEEQMRGLTPALAEADGRIVADLGCAEGLISHAFARAGASFVWGCDCMRENIEVARRLSGNIAGRCEFDLADINKLMLRESFQYDIVLALAIIHKLHNPAEALRWAAGMTLNLFVIRLPSHGADGNLKSKQNPAATANVNEILPACGLTLERTEEGPRGEPVQYWRRTAV